MLFTGIKIAVNSLPDSVIIFIEVIIKVLLIHNP